MLRSLQELRCAVKWCAVSALALLGLAASLGAAAEERKNCDVEQVKRELSASIGKALGGGIRSSSCAGVNFVLLTLREKTVTGGRKLEPPKALSIPDARAERNAALADPEFKAALDADLADETDATRRTLLEAALLHEFGKYKARDLLLMSLRGENTK